MAALLRPLSTSQLLDQTFSLYRKNFVLFAGIVAIPQLVLLALQLSMLGVSAVGASMGAAGVPLMGILTAVLGLAMLVVAILAMTVAHAASVNGVAAVYLERPISIGEAYSRVRGIVGKVVNVVISVSLRVFLGFLLLIIPGIIWMLRYSLSVPVIALEKNLTAKQAMQRSKQLTEGHLGEVFLIYFLFGILTYIILFAVTIPVLGGLALLKVPEKAALFQIGNHVSSFVASVLVGPFATIAMSILYYDLRVRKEAFDLQLMMQQMDGAQAAAAAGNHAGA